MKKVISLIMSILLVLNLGVVAEASSVVLPNIDTNMHLYMDYRKITDTNSVQYKYQEKCRTNAYGIRVYDGYLAVAIGDFYSTNIGDTYHVLLENGTEFDIFVADSKGSTGGLKVGTKTINYDGEDCMNILEFVVDEDLMLNKIKCLGTFSGLDIFGGLYGNGGNIKEMTYTGHISVSNDI